MKINNICESAVPQIVSIVYNPAAIRLRYPNGDIWEYLVYDNYELKQLVRSYRRNKGRLASALKRYESQKIEPPKPKAQQKLFEAIDFESLFGKDFDGDRSRIVSKGKPQQTSYTLQLYRGFNITMDKLKRRGGSFVLSPKRSEQRLIWFTNGFMLGNPREYVAGRGSHVLTYPLEVVKHFQEVLWSDGTTSTSVPQEINDLSEPTNNCRFFSGIELPEGWVFSYKNEKFIGCSIEILVTPDMLTLDSDWEIYPESI